MDCNITFKSNVFYSFKSLVGSSHDHLIMWWIQNLNIGMGHLTFDCNGQHIWLKHLDQLIGVVRFLIKKKGTQLGCEIVKNEMK